MREYERRSGTTPDLIKNPIDFPVGYFEARWGIVIVMNSGKTKMATDEEEALWADNRLKLPRLLRPGRF